MDMLQANTHLYGCSISSYSSSCDINVYMIALLYYSCVQYLLKLIRELS